MILTCENGHYITMGGLPGCYAVRSDLESGYRWLAIGRDRL